ncbi:MAG TPA: DNA-formamidopyrimidine glycosylase family protein [Bacteroidia bacterium]|nr:DNA-formamidopyrimidine glycosylase family protein [Bacteroidia bacterium]
MARLKAVFGCSFDVLKLIVMPEGPSIVILKEEVQAFKGKTVQAISGNAKIDLQRMNGRKVNDFLSWGKHFLICFDGFYIRVHLLLFGSYRVNERREMAPRISFQFENGELNFYNCSVKLNEGEPGDFYDWEVDTMSEKWNPSKALKALQGMKDTEACDALLDQNVFAGSGNIIKNEVLFQRHINPETLVETLTTPEKKELIKALRDYCFDFYTWKKAYVLKKHWQVYRASMCPDCHLPLTRRHTGKTNRRSFFCTHCQVLRRSLPVARKKKSHQKLTKTTTRA